MTDSTRVVACQELLDEVTALLPKFGNTRAGNQLAQVAEELKRDINDINRMELEMSALRK